MKANLNHSPLSGNIYWGRTNGRGVAVGEQRDVTSEFLQVMELKFPINTYQLISVNGENKYATISVDLSKEVVVNGVTYQSGVRPYFAEIKQERDELLEFAQEVRRSDDTRLASMAIAIIAKATGGEV